MNRRCIWTASQYIQLIIEVIFGISYNSSKEEVVISPKLTDEMRNTYLALKNLKLSSNVSMDVVIDRGTTACFISDNSLKVRIVNT